MLPELSIQTWTLIIAMVTAVTCGLCGSLLLLNRQAMVSEGLSHAVLPGLVIAFLLFRSFSSPWLLLFAAGSGLLMVLATELLSKTRLVDSDAGLGIVFAGMFSFGVLLVSMELRNVHFHADCIIDGNLSLTPLDRMEVPGLGPVPKSFVTMSGLLLAALTFILVCYKELKVMIFDPMHSLRLGLRPRLISYLWLSLVSLTAVAAFDAAGSILIVALMIAPPATAFLLTQRFDWFLYLSAGVSGVCSLLGYFMASRMEISPTGPTASAAGLVFLVVLVAGPKRSVLAEWLGRGSRRDRMRLSLAAEIAGSVATRGDAERAFERTFRISDGAANRLMEQLLERQLVTCTGGDIDMTEAGRNEVRGQLKDFPGSAANST
ncbi:MAG: metal ABC transporter permease [Planctomycetota bacterium]